MRESLSKAPTLIVNEMSHEINAIEEKMLRSSHAASPSPVATTPPTAPTLVSYQRESSRNSLLLNGHSNSYSSLNNRTASFGSSSGHGSSPNVSESFRASGSRKPISSSKLHKLVEFIDKAVDDAYNLCHGFGGIRWNPSKTRDGVSICRAKAMEEGKLDAAIRGKCSINATFEEMMDTLITETNDDFIAHEKCVNPAEFLEGELLYVLVPRTETDRFVCVKWYAVKSLAPSVAKHRDYVYVEVVDQFVNRDGHKVGYRLSKSIELESFAPPDAHLFVRGKTLSFHTFRVVSQEPQELEFYTMVINDLGEKLPSWLVHKMVENTAVRCACLRDYIDQKRLKMMVFAKPSDMVPLNKRLHCTVCTKSFSLVRKKYHCAVCGDVICGQCCVNHTLFSTSSFAMTSNGGGDSKKRARICAKCTLNAKSKQLPRRVHRNSSLRNSDLTHTSSMMTQGSSVSSFSQSSSFNGLSTEEINALIKAGTMPPLEGTSPASTTPQKNSITKSMSTIETSSNDSLNSTTDESMRVHPTGGTPQRTSIPHMFQFRPSFSAPPNPCPSADTPPQASFLDESDDDQEFYLDGTMRVSCTESIGITPTEAPTLPTTVTISSSSSSTTNSRPAQLQRSNSAAPVQSAPSSGGELDLGIGKYKASYSNPKKLPTTISFDLDGLTTSLPAKITSQKSSPSLIAATSSSSLPPTTRNSLVKSSSDASLLRDSERISSSVDIPDLDDEDVQVVKAVVQKIPRRKGRRSSVEGRRSSLKGNKLEESPKLRANSDTSSPPKSAGTGTTPTDSSFISATNFSLDLTHADGNASGSASNSFSEPSSSSSNTDTAPSSTGSTGSDDPQNDLQAKMDQINRINENLRRVQVIDPEDLSRLTAANEHYRESVAGFNSNSIAQELADLAREEQEQAKAIAASVQGTAAAVAAAAAAAVAGNGSSSASFSSTESEEVEIEEPVAQVITPQVRQVRSSSRVDSGVVGVYCGEEETDGGFSHFLADSSFEDVCENSESSGDESNSSTLRSSSRWKSVHSKTTGKVYYYNETCGTTSWTLPSKADEQDSYVVL